MRIVKKKYYHYINDNINIEIDMNSKIKYNFYIVYYVNCICNINYMDWVIKQLRLVTTYNNIIYLIATINKNDEDKFRSKFRKFNNIIIECNYENNYEYSGILKVWELGQKLNKRNDIILYYHSKGITRHPKYSYNKHDNYNIILKDIKLIKEIYTLFPTIDKIGYFCGGNGWQWYNFWYVRSSYINKVEKPILTTRRHYYEDWLGRKVNNENELICEHERKFEEYQNSLNSCYNIYTDKKEFGNIGSFYCPENNKMFLINTNLYK